MYQNISEWLTVDYLLVYKVLLSHTYIHQNSRTLAYVPENIVLRCRYGQVTYVNARLFPDVYFIFTACTVVQAVV